MAMNIITALANISACRLGETYIQCAEDIIVISPIAAFWLVKVLKVSRYIYRALCRACIEERWHLSPGGVRKVMLCSAKGL